MRRILAFLAVLGIGTPPLTAAEVYVDYDHDADLSSYRTFAYRGSEPTPVRDEDPLVDERIVQKIRERLAAAGFEEVGSDPDMYVTYRVTTEQHKQFYTSTFGYGTPGGFRWGGWGGGIGTATTTETSFVEGTLVIDARDAKTENLIWRGGSTHVLGAKPEKRIQQIEAALDKIARKWHRMKKDGGS